MTHSYNLLNEATVLMNCVLSASPFLLSLTPYHSLLLSTHPLSLSLSPVPILSSLPSSCSLQGVDGEPFE